MLRAIFLALLALPAIAQDNRSEVAQKIGAKPEELRQSPIAGVYEYAKGADIAYVSQDGKFVIDGDLYDIDSNRNLSEATRRTERMKLMSDLPEAQMVVYAPKDPKYPGRSLLGIYQKASGQCPVHP